MPIYEYRCDAGHEFEVIQAMRDDPIAKCEVCGAPVQRIFHPVAVHFKGSGFYTTDYARKSSSGGSGSDGAGSSKESAKSNGSGKKEAPSGSKKGEAAKT